MHGASELFTYPYIVNSTIHVQLDELVKFSKIPNQDRKNTNVCSQA